MRTEPDPPNGFTLLEMLVALSVFALAALTLLRMEGASIAQTADLDQRFLREVEAQNLAAEWMTDPTAPALGKSSGTSSNNGRKFAWERVVSAGPTPGSVLILLSLRETTQGAGGQTLQLQLLRRNVP